MSEEIKNIVPAEVEEEIIQKMDKLVENGAENVDDLLKSMQNIDPEVLFKVMKGFGIGAGAVACGYLGYLAKTGKLNAMVEAWKDRQKKAKDERKDLKKAKDDYRTEKARIKNLYHPKKVKAEKPAEETKEEKADEATPAVEENK